MILKPITMPRTFSRNNGGESTRPTAFASKSTQTLGKLAKRVPKGSKTEIAKSKRHPYVKGNRNDKRRKKSVYAERRRRQHSLTRSNPTQPNPAKEAKRVFLSS
jgi:hypothetical protein